MVIGFDETLDERLEHLERTRDFQDACLRDGYDGLFSFLCWTYKPYGTAFGGARSRRTEYRRWIALSRIFLDNVRHVRTSVLTQNEDAFRALDYGADDFDLPIEDEVTQKAGARIDLDLEGLLAIPRRLGYRVEYRRAERPPALVGTRQDGCPNRRARHAHGGAEAVAACGRASGRRRRAATVRPRAPEPAVRLATRLPRRGPTAGRSCAAPARGRARREAFGRAGRGALRLDPRSGIPPTRRVTLGQRRVAGGTRRGARRAGRTRA